MKAKYRYFISELSKQAIQFGCDGKGYWKHDNLKEVSGLSLSYFITSFISKEVNRKQFFKYLKLLKNKT